MRRHEGCIDGPPVRRSAATRQGRAHGLRNRGLISPPGPGRRGIVLITVLWIAAVIGLIGATFAFRAVTDRKAVYYMRHRVQAQFLAESAVEHARAVLAADDPTADNLAEAWDDDDELADVTIDAEGQAVYSVIGRPDLESGTVRYGLVDECGKVNINTATREMLMALPGVTEEIADAIIDWRDPDDTPGPRGAESAYYTSLKDPYNCKNEPFESVAELLLVRGITERILYGEDANRNGILDPNEDDGDARPPDDNKDGQLDLGLYRYVTVWSRTPNVDAEGNPRVDLNTEARQLRSLLQPLFEDQQAVNQILNLRRQRTFTSVGEILDAPAVTNEMFAEVWDRLTVGTATVNVGLINPNTAPAPVLAAALEVSPDEAEAIVGVRAEAPDSAASIVWLLQFIGREKFKTVANRLTLRSHQFSCEAVGRYTNRPVFKRVWVVLDRTQTTIRVVHWKDLTGLGLAYPAPEVGTTRVRGL